MSECTLSNDADDRLNHVPFKALQQSFTDYATLFSRLFFFLIRVISPDNHSGYELSLNRSQIQSTRQLTQLLSTPAPVYDQFKTVFQSLAYSLLTTQPGSDLLSLTVPPLLSFVIISSLHSDGSWDQPASITPRLARIQWGSRVVVFQQILSIIQANPPADSSELET